MIIIGDLLQLLPVIPGSDASVSKRLITHCDWFKDVVLFGLFQPMRSLDPKWINYLVNVCVCVCKDIPYF